MNDSRIITPEKAQEVLRDDARKHYLYGWEQNYVHTVATEPERTAALREELKAAQEYAEALGDQNAEMAQIIGTEPERIRAAVVKVLRDEANRLRHEAFGRLFGTPGRASIEEGRARVISLADAIENGADL